MDKIRSFYDVGRELYNDTLQERNAAYCKNLLADLDTADLSIAANYHFALQTGNNIAHTKSMLIKRVTHLYRQAMLSPLGSRDWTTARIKLMNFQKLIRGNIPVSEIMAAIRALNIREPQLNTNRVSLESLYTRPMTVVTPDGLPKDVKVLQKNIICREKGISYWQIVSGNARTIVFIPFIERTIKLMSPEDQATEEELTRTVFIDPLGEIPNTPSPAWSISQACVHESLHVEWYDKKGDDLFLIRHASNERQANIGSYDFLNDLLCSSFPKSKKDIADIKDRINIKKDMIRNYNRQLGIVSESGL